MHVSKSVQILKKKAQCNHMGPSIFDIYIYIKILTYHRPSKMIFIPTNRLRKNEKPSTSSSKTKAGLNGPLAAKRDGAEKLVKVFAVVESLMYSKYI